jgi:hypothetical protein
MLRFDETPDLAGTFREPAGYANGNSVDRQGRPLTCEQWRPADGQRLYIVDSGTRMLRSYFGKIIQHTEPVMRLIERVPMGLRHRSSLLGFLIVILLAAAPSASLADTSASHCIADVRTKYGASPAFKVTCITPADCEFEPSQSMNASAMAFIDATAKRVMECWEKAGLTIAVPMASPPEIKLSVRRYHAPNEKGSEMCTIAEFKPFGEDKLTTSFRAACLGAEQD